MKYSLSSPQSTGAKASIMKIVKRFLPFLADEKLSILIALTAILLNSGLNLLTPYLIGHTVDTYIATKDFQGVLMYSGFLLATYFGALVAGFVQTRVMGGVGQRVLFKLRNAVFTKLQELPVAFFNENKAGDLISRINNDTDKLNQFFSQAIMQFVGNAFVILGAGISVLILNVRLGAAVLAPAFVLLVITRLLTAWIKSQNARSLQTTGGFSAQIQESLENFKVIVAFNRRDYFREKLREANAKNYTAAVGAGIANNTFTPIYGLSQSAAQIIVMAYGTFLITQGHLTIGLLISFFTYTTRFYDPLRQIASFWSSFQTALAAWDRVAAILSLESEMKVMTIPEETGSKALLAFERVRFSYEGGKEVLHNVSFALERGKTYALVGPTGGGKTTTASLMARLYDPTEGRILLDGQDIRSFEIAERTRKIGFILQEPFLFTGTVRENILYGNDEYLKHTNEEIMAELMKSGLEKLLVRFDQGLDTPVTAGSDSMSLGQRQLIAFMRAALRQPELLILDEATANIDTVTEQLLGEILDNLPKSTTKVIIAHRLNTIENADEIFFVNSGEVIPAGSLEHAVSMLMQGKRQG